jgi:hypothetical protein
MSARIDGPDQSTPARLPRARRSRTVLLHAASALRKPSRPGSSIKPFLLLGTFASERHSHSSQPPR